MGGIIFPNKPVQPIEDEPPAGQQDSNPLPILPSTAHFKSIGDQINGIYGESTRLTGVVGFSKGLTGVSGDGPVFGMDGRSDGGVGVNGTSTTGDGVVGTGRRGVVGHSDTFQGVFGKSRDNAGLVGESDKFHALFAVSHDRNNGGVFGTNTVGGFGVIGRSDAGIGVLGRGGTLAARFEGDVEVTGDIRLANADCAEDFDIAAGQPAEPGTVMVLGEEGELQQSHRAYDKRVAGVISGAGRFKPGIVLDRCEPRQTRQPLALLGKVYCKVDAQYGAVEVGDLLTTSATAGHAMKAGAPLQAFGAVIGKALRPLKNGQALIPILIALQ